MHSTVVRFVQEHLGQTDIAGNSVLEVGALDFNGSIRTIVEALGPSSYIGVDMQPGPGVDRVMTVAYLVDSFGDNQFDVVISTEMLEHVQDWRWAVSQMKRVTAPGGRLMVTTRSPGFMYHGYPHDFWRFTVADFESIFADMADVVVEADTEWPGVMLYATKPIGFAEISTAQIDVAVAPHVPLPGLRRQLKATVSSRLGKLRRKMSGGR